MGDLYANALFLCIWNLNDLKTCQLFTLEGTIWLCYIEITQVWETLCYGTNVSPEIHVLAVLGNTALGP